MVKAVRENDILQKIVNKISNRIVACSEKCACRWKTVSTNMHECINVSTRVCGELRMSEPDDTYTSEFNSCSLQFRVHR